MNSILDRGNFSLKRLSESCARLSDFRQRLVGSLPPASAREGSNLAPPQHSEIFVDRSHSLLGEIEDRLQDLEANINLLESFFTPQDQTRPTLGKAPY